MDEMMKFPDSMKFADDEVRYEDRSSNREERWVPIMRKEKHTFWKRIVVGRDGTIQEDEKLFLIKVKIHSCIQDTRSLLTRMFGKKLPYTTYGELNIPIGKKGIIHVQRLVQRAKGGIVTWAGNDVDAEEEAKRMFDDAESIERLGDFVLVTLREPPPIQESIPEEPQIVMHPNPPRMQLNMQMDIGGPEETQERSATVGTNSASIVESRPLTLEEQLRGRYVIVKNMYKGLESMTIHVSGLETEGFIDESNAIISIVVRRSNEHEFTLETEYEEKTYNAILKEDGTIDGELPPIAITALTPTWKQVRLPTVIRRENGVGTSSKREPDVMYYRVVNDFQITKSGRLERRGD